MSITLGLGVLSATNLILTFGMNATLLATLGAGPRTDAFFASLIVPQILTAVLATPLVGALLPQLAGESEETLRRRGWTTLLAASTLLGAAALLLGALCSAWIPLLLPGFSPETRRLTATLTGIQMAGIVPTALLSILVCVSHARKRFVAAEAAELVANGLALFALVVLLSRLGVTAAAWIYVARPLLAAMMLLPLLGRYLPPAADDPFLKTLWRNLRLPLLGTAYNKLGFVVDRLLCSLSPAGALSLFHFTEKLYAAGIEVSRSALVAPAIPLLTEHAKKGQWTSFRGICRIRLGAIAACGAAVLLLVLTAGRALLHLLPGKTGLTEGDLQLMGALLASFGGFLACGPIGIFLVHAFYSTGKTDTPTWVTALSSTLGIGLKIATFPVLGLLGVAGASSFIQCFSAALLLLLLRSRIRQNAAAAPVEPAAS